MKFLTVKMETKSVAILQKEFYIIVKDSILYSIL